MTRSPGLLGGCTGRVARCLPAPLVLALLLTVGGGRVDPGVRLGQVHEAPGTDPLIHLPPAAVGGPEEAGGVETPASVVLRSRAGIGSVQVNVDGFGHNTTGDAANEPSLAVDPTNPARMVITWRQFDSIASNFRQAGWAYSHNGGRSWTCPGIIDPGVKRSDPVVVADNQGNFYFYSLRVDDFTCQMFKSTDWGVSWSGPVWGYGGDKCWFTVDRTGGIGEGHLYATWSLQGCCGSAWLTRSTDGGQSFETPVPFAIDDAERPFYGVVAVGPDGEVYVVGRRAVTSPAFTIVRSTTLRDASQPMDIDYYGSFDLGGRIVNAPGSGPNPGGLLGQVWVAVDHSTGPRHGNVYVLCSIKNQFISDPLDIHFIRSADGGATWSTPIRVNDDPAGTNAWQWFGTLSVAPNGRIDAVWNDTREDPTAVFSELFYTHSVDGGLTWSANTPISPPFNPGLGCPNENNKLGDYYDMTSDNAGVNLAYAATFNGEHDIYFVRIPAFDCNGNGIPDADDIAAGTSYDCDTNGVPDECDMTGGDCNTNGILDVCELAAGTGADCNHNLQPDDCDIAFAASADCNGNQTPDECELAGNDCNANGVLDPCELAGHDCNGNGALDACDVSAGTSDDCNQNGVPDECELTGNDCNTNDVPDTCELAGHDCNANGVLDSCDLAAGTSGDCNHSSIPDECELAGHDCNANRVPDECDLVSGTSGDCNHNSMPDECELAGHDCNANDALDSCDLAGGTSMDCNENARPDECDITLAVSTDCNHDTVPDECQLAGHDCNANGVLDSCDLAGGTSLDCNANLRPDECDIALGVSKDCNHDAVPDECQLVGHDCNANSVPDSCDLAGGTSVDCNGNTRPDECDIALGVSRDCNHDAVPDECQLAGHDCNANGVPDSCDVSGGTSVDCNGNTRPDECDIALGVSKDCNHDTVPDECQLAGHDCNANGVLDSCDLVGGTSADCNGNTRPDECDIALGASKDCNHDAVPDECQIAGHDCNTNNVLDSCDVAGATSLDCNANLLPDECDIASGASRDCNHDAIPDECQLVGHDCNANGVLDSCDMSGGTSLDCNANLRPDECDIAGGSSPDANGNQVPDECEPRSCATTETAKLLAVDGVEGDLFGTAVAASGDITVIGAPGDDDRGANAGTAFVFRANGSAWVQECKLVAADGAAGDSFGSAVAVAGDTIVVGANKDADRGAESGSAYVFHFNGSTWVQQQKLLASDGLAGDWFGQAVAVSGDTILIGAGKDNDQGSDSGSVFVFRYNGANWVQVQKLWAPDAAANDYFGSALALPGTVVAIGASGDDTSSGNTGSVYVFRDNGASWTFEQKLTAPDAASSDALGAAVSAASGLVVAGAAGQDALGNNAGAAYVFRHNGSTWTMEQKLLAGDGTAGDFFGAGVAVIGDTVVVGAYGDDDGGSNAGSAYVFHFDGAAWTQQVHLTASGASSSDQFGFAATAKENAALIGATSGRNLQNRRSGSVFAFAGVSEDCNADYTLDICDLRLGLSTDFNANSVPDECDGHAPGDFDLDGDVDGDDYRWLADCLAGPEQRPVPTQTTTMACRAAFDGDADGDVDLVDAASFQRSFTGPNP